MRVGIVPFSYFMIILFTTHSFGNSFEVVWNAPVDECQKFNVTIDVTKYGIKANRYSGWVGSEITIFYAQEMGLYPRVETKGLVNGGIPQKVNLKKHFEKCKSDINRFIPEASFDGHAIIDYESWRPLWERNFDYKDIYRHLSEQLVKARHPTWSKQQVKEEAKKQFELAARLFLTGTIQTATSLRPKGKWGYYLFPDCYTDQGKRTCSQKEKNLNDKLLWMFNASTAIYPSAYLPNPNNVTQNKDYIFRTLQEASRVRSKLPGPTRPIYLYSRIRYRDTLQWYTERDLENAIKQPHDLLIDGVVIWGESKLDSTATICNSLKHYIDSTLGPFVQKLIKLRYQTNQEYLWKSRNEHMYQRRLHFLNRRNHRRHHGIRNNRYRIIINNMFPQTESKYPHL